MRDLEEVAALHAEWSAALTEARENGDAEAEREASEALTELSRERDELNAAILAENEAANAARLHRDPNEDVAISENDEDQEDEA